jgi:hypothetical protein
MLFKIGNRIINTDNITKAEFKPGPPPGTSAAQAATPTLKISFNYLTGQVAESETFSGHEASSLWESLSQSAQDVELKQSRRPR